MTLEEANAELDKIIEEYSDTVYCKAALDRYGMPVAITLEGDFLPSTILRIAKITGSIER